MTRIIRTLLIAITMIVSYVTVFAQQIFHEQLAEIEAKHFVQELAFSDAVTDSDAGTRHQSHCLMAV